MKKYLLLPLAIALLSIAPQLAFAVNQGDACNTPGSIGECGGGGLVCSTSYICDVVQTSNGGGGGALNTAVLTQIAGQLVFFINIVLVPVLIALAFIVFLWGVFKAYIWKHGEEEVSNAHQLILWGIVGFVVIFSLWGIVNVGVSLLNLDNNVHPAYPKL